MSMLLELRQPALDRLECIALGDIVDEQSALGAAVVGGCDGTIALLPRSVPDLGLNDFVRDAYGARRKFYADGRFRIEVDFVARKAGQEVAFPYSAVSDENDCDGEDARKLVCI